MKYVRLLGTGLALTLALAGHAAAQAAWDSPLLLPPRPTPGFGIFRAEVHGADLGVLGTWRSGGVGALGVRFGIADRPGGLAGFGGVDFSGTLTRASSDFPLDISWIAGAGAGFGRWLRVSFPFGVSIGHTFTGDGVRFTPYLSPRLVLDGNFGRNRPRVPDDDRLNLGFAADLGIDIDPGSGWLVRFGGTFGDRDAIAIGLVF